MHYRFLDLDPGMWCPATCLIWGMGQSSHKCVDEPPMLTRLVLGTHSMCASPCISQTCLFRPTHPGPWQPWQERVMNVVMGDFILEAEPLVQWSRAPPSHSLGHPGVNLWATHVQTSVSHWEIQASHIWWSIWCCQQPWQIITNH